MHYNHQLAICTPRYEFQPAAASYLEETRHGLISTTNLDLEEGCLSRVAIVLRTLHFNLVGVVPCAGPAKHVLPLFPRELPPAEQGGRDGVLVRAGAAFKAILAREARRGHGEDVAAVWADCNRRLLLVQVYEGSRLGVEVLTEKHVGGL